MTSLLSKGYVCALFSQIAQTWKVPDPPIQIPAFTIELRYIDCFQFNIAHLPFHMEEDIEGFMNRYIEDAWELAFKKICRLLDQHPEANGVPIYELMNNRQFILRRHRTAYNRQVPGKSPKGLTPNEWEDYNHWTLTILYWQALVQSQQYGYTVTMCEALDELPIDVLPTDAFKALWCMRCAYEAAGSPYLGPEGDCISVRPYAAWHHYNEYRKNAKRGTLNA